MDDRLTDVEIKLAFAERRIDELDDVVRQVSETVDILTKEVARLRKVVGQPDAAPANEKPPHY